MKSKQPNILFIMCDQMAGPALSIHGGKTAKTPNIETLAEAGVVFESSYCNSPLCAPSRFSMMAGQLPSHISAYDNAAEFAAAIPTFAHYLRALGYRTCLAGKMHFVGPDQLHGFEERLTTDIYPSDFGWTPDWEHPDQRVSWYHNMLSVVQAGLAETTNQLDYDEEVAFQSTRKIYDMARGGDERPFCFVVSFTHPHDPYAIAQEYWDRYDHDKIDMPAVAPIPVDKLDPHSRRVRRMCAMDQYELTEARVRNARHAYYGAMSYIDDKVGQLLRALKATGLRDDTIVLFISDHGDMLGERGLWYKMTFFEWSARVPMIFHAPGRLAPRRVSKHVSLVDLLPTLVDFASEAKPSEFADRVDGQSLVPLLHGDESGWPDTALGEYLGEGAAAPVMMIRRGNYKYVYSEPDPEQLYGLAADANELENLAGQAEHEEMRRAFHDEIMRRYDPLALRRSILASQQRRHLLAKSLLTGRHTPWDFQPFRAASRQYMRNHLDLNELERSARFPMPETPEPDYAGDER